MWIINVIVKGILKVLRIRQVGESAHPLSMEELRTLVLSWAASSSPRSTSRSS